MPNFDDKTKKLIDSINLVAILNEAQKTSCNVFLVAGKIDDKIYWSTNVVPLSYNYILSSEIIHLFISSNKDKIIKIKVVSNNLTCPLNRNIIFYVPVEHDIASIRNQYAKYGDHLKSINDFAE